jgi:hypothetical protein
MRDQRKFMGLISLPENLPPTNPWENGSDFHWMYPWTMANSPMPWEENYLLMGTGREAFRALISFGQANRNWRRLWIPSYFCQVVVASLISTGIEVLTYPDSPRHPGAQWANLEFRPGDVLLLVNYFGLRDKFTLPAIDHHAIEIIEDHTHDPWSHWAWSSDADWCVASLRKTLPIPDGGVLWSPAGHQLPPAAAVTPQHRLAAQDKFAAMVIKSLYLGNTPVKKKDFRRLAIAGEESYDRGEVSGIDEWVAGLLSTFPVEAWREQRRLNHQTMSACLADLPWVEVLQPANGSLPTPFSAVLVCDSPARQSRLRERLISANIFPAILWPLDEAVIAGIPPEHLDLSRRMLSIHCDMRYIPSDMEHIASLISKFGASQNG